MYNPRPDAVTITLPIRAWGMLDGMAAAFDFVDANGRGKIAAFMRAYEQGGYKVRRRSPDRLAPLTGLFLIPEPLSEDYEPKPIPKVVDLLLPISTYRTLVSMAEQVGYRDEAGGGDIVAFLLGIANGDVEVVHHSEPPDYEELRIFHSGGSPSTRR